MLPTLAEQDIELVRQTVREAMSRKLNLTHSQQQDQALGGEFLISLAEQVMIPILVSLCASVLYDVLKGKTLGALQKSDACAVLGEFLGKEARLDLPLGPQCVEELRAQLTPLGFTDADIVGVYESVKQELAKNGDRPEKECAAIKILFLTANPSGTTQLKLDKEIREIDQALRLAEFRDRFDIKQHWAVRVTDLQDLLLRHKPDIVHFSGHGSAANELVLEDASGKRHPVSARVMSQLFSVLKDNIRCVVLNACYSEPQARAIAQHIDCVIGMSEAIGDAAAISFATAFYRALGYGRDVETAFKLGCMQIDLEKLGEQNTPRLLAVRGSPAKIVFVHT